LTGVQRDGDAGEIPTAGAPGAPGKGRSDMSKGRQAGDPLARPAIEVPGSPCRIRDALHAADEDAAAQARR
jgi:hypothetical protein